MLSHNSLSDVLPVSLFFLPPSKSIRTKASKVTLWKYKSSHIILLLITVIGFHCHQTETQSPHDHLWGSVWPGSWLLAVSVRTLALYTSATLHMPGSLPLLGLDLAVSSARCALFPAIHMAHSLSSYLYLSAACLITSWSLIEKFQLIPSVPLPWFIFPLAITYSFF